MIESSIHFLQTAILPWGALGVFFASVAEEVIAPIPSALVMTMAGFLFVTGPLSWQAVYALIFKVAIPAALGVAMGSYVVYFIARFGGKLIIEKWGKFVGLHWSDIEKLQNRMGGTRKDEILIVGARILPFVPSVAISAFCGILGMNVWKYFLISFAGVFLRGIILGVLGWQAGELFEKYARTISSLENLVLISTIAVAAVLVVVKYRRNV